MAQEDKPNSLFTFLFFLFLVIGFSLFSSS
jgi:hypothetical protein